MSEKGRFISAIMLLIEIFLMTIITKKFNIINSQAKTWIFEIASYILIFEDLDFGIVISTHSESQLNSFDLNIVWFILTWNLTLSYSFAQSMISNENSKRNQTKLLTLSIISFIIYICIGITLPKKGLSFWILKHATRSLLISILFVLFTYNSKKMKQLNEIHQLCVYDGVFILIYSITFHVVAISSEQQELKALFPYSVLVFFKFIGIKSKIKKYKMLSFGDEIDLEEETTCTICQESTTHATKLKCGHVFHKQCLIEWTVKSADCPLCRKTIEKGDENTAFIVNNNINENIDNIDIDNNNDDINNNNDNIDENNTDNNDNENDEIDNWEIVENNE